MILVDRALADRARAGRPLRVGLVGAGFMARGVLRQIRQSVPGMVVAAVANRRVEGARRAYEEAGVADPVAAGGAEALAAALAAGRAAVTDDAALLCAADGLDAIVDATGAIEFGARLALECFAHGRTLVTLNVELDATVGAALAARAAAAGALYTVADGDQPGVQLNLVRHVRGMGLVPLVCGNVKGLHDPYRTPTTQRAFAARWGQNATMVTSFADGTKVSFEQACVANATGMTVARRGMNGWTHDGHVDELVGRYDVEALRACGGVVDYVVGARPAPGVFVLAAHDDPVHRHYLALYKLGPGPLYSFYVPYHLCHFEVPFSIARAVLFGDATLVAAPRPTVDVVATAKRDLAAGDVLDGPGGYDAYGQCERVALARREGLLPMGLAESARLRRAVARDAVLTLDDVELPEGRVVDALRREQESAAMPSPMPRDAPAAPGPGRGRSRAVLPA